MSLRPHPALLAVLVLLGSLWFLDLISPGALLSGILLAAIAAHPDAWRRDAGLPLEIAAWATPLVLLVTLHGDVLGGWWTRDDPCLLRSAIEHGALAHFTDPAVWRPLSGNVLMPWSILSLGTDHAIAGLTPSAFYAHQLLAFAMLLAIAHVVLRGILSPAARATGLAVLTTSAAAHEILGQLMNRHYLEGTLLVLLAMALYVHAVRSGRTVPALGGAVLYLLATTAKEVFVPVVAILPLLPIRTLRRRLNMLVPYGIAALGYVGWRIWMLGVSNSLTGYGTRSASQRGMFELATAAGLTTPAAALTVLLLLTGAAYLVLRRHRRWTPAIVGLTAILAMPLAPVLRDLEARHFLLPSLAASILLGAALQELPWTRHSSWTARAARATLSVSLVLAGLAVLTQAPAWRHGDAAAAHYQAEGTFLLDGHLPDGTPADADDLLLTELADAAFLACLADLDPDPEEDPGFCGDPCWCAERFPGTYLWSPTGHGVRLATPPTGCTVQRPMEVELAHDARRSRLSWSFSSPETGSWAVLLVYDAERPEISVPLPLPTAGETAWTLETALQLVVRHQAADGSASYSPMLSLPPAGEVRWASE